MSYEFAKMTHEHYTKFKIPSEQKEFHKSADKVCVVSVIGKGRQDFHHSKASVLNNIVKRDVFQGPSEEDRQYDNMVDIEGHYDENNKVVFLHLWSAQDNNAMADMCQKASDEISQLGYHNFLQSTEYQHAKAMLYMFSISHIILLVHQGSSFDVTYIRLFRVLDTIRSKIQVSVTEALRGLGLPREWVVSGRPCSPRVLFIFERSTIGPDTADTMVMSKTRSQKTPPIKRLQHAIEDQIYRILRKARIITNISNNSLFAVPANQEFVYVFQRTESIPDPVSYYLGELRKNCITARDADNPRNRSYQTNRRGNQSGRSHNTGADTSAGNATSTRQQTTGPFTPVSSDHNNFKEFLWQHIDLAHAKGFDDNVGRNPIPAVFELPQLHIWFDVSYKLYDFFLCDHPDSRSKPHFNTLKSLLEIDGRFSELRCTKILPIAERAYREGLPCHYTRGYHLSKVEQAKQVFQQHARGPACEKYLKQLADSCDKVWQLGRQQCEEKSLTDQPCVNALHRLPEIPESDLNASLPVMSHTSQVKNKCACNCGNKQAEREDPFDHRSANYDFYQKIEPQCCSKLEHFQLPLFQPSTTEIKADGLADEVETTEEEEKEKTAELSQSAEDKQDNEHDEDPGILITSTDVARKDSSVKIDLATGMSELSLALSLGQSGGGSDMYGENTNTSASFNPEGSHDLENMVVTDDSDNVLSPLRQVSTTEYLPGMLHSDGPVGLLPKFPSWSLVCLGKYSSYIPAQGLDQPGFMHGSNFLLPWDVTIKLSGKEKWPAVGETPSGKKGKLGQRKVIKESGEVAVRLYVGMEYECPRGHRFLLSAPDKVFKAPANGNFKETAHKVMTSDMPLYFPCHCRSAKGFMGRLMRFFVAVPEGPVDVKLNARVKAHPSPSPVFYPSSEGAILLTPGVWVLRLPYVYLGETGVYLMPSEAQDLLACRLYKGLLSVQEAF